MAANTLSDYFTLDATDISNLDSVAPGVSGIVADTQKPGETWYETLARSIPLLAATVQQKQLLDIQVDRARNGLPPLNVSQYAAGAQVGLSADTKTYLMWGAIGFGALWLFSRSSGRGRK